MPEFYIQRKLHRGDKLLVDSELVGQSGIFVVLAEPGAGKSDLLDFLSKSYEVPRQPASQFVHEAPATKSVLVIDALDEVARIGEEKINEIIVKARASTATTVIFASRSYVWDQARTTAVRDCFGVEPNILRLEPFDDDEQRQLFADYLPCEDFEAFRTEATRFELTPILGNPQFLKLFADAYVQGGRRFSSKKQIYADAVRRLAGERRNAPGATARPEIDAIVAAASEIFAKLLLSGALGVSANEEIEGDVYPYLRSIAANAEIADFALNTRLFKPTDTVNRHDPVHRIVAEYCAANYLIKRIEDPTNTFSLRRCLAVVAPNSTVRNELRGLLGWMASLGNRDTQQTIVKLDPYAVLNGDASQLDSSVKPMLLNGLRSLAENDPFFRRMDSWRKFNVAGFFTADMIAHVRPLLSGTNSKTHLRGLMLELLYDTEAGRGLETEFRTILLDPQAEEHDRDRAYQNIAAISKGGLVNDFNTLVTQPTRDSLDIASQILRDEGISRMGKSRALAFVKALATLYPESGLREHRLGSRYFIRQVISTFSLNDTRYLLNGITSNLACTCGKLKPHPCTCRRGISKIAGYLLDRYFELMVGPHDPRQIRRWTERLVFENHKNGDQSKSVESMSQNAGLRQAIQTSMIGGLTHLDEIIDTRVNFFMSSTHSGSSFRGGDHDALVDHALAVGNHLLWEHLIVMHSRYDSSSRGPNPARARMKAQARSSPELLRIWTKANRAYDERVRKDHVKFGHSRRHYERIEAERKADVQASFEANRALIEAGRHWGWLRAFAQRYLHGAHEDDPIIDDEQLIEAALCNCFDFLAAEVPSLDTIAARGSGDILMVLEAACLATFRKTGTLVGIPLDMLRAIKAGGIGGSAYQKDEAERFELSIDGLIFSSDADKIEFITHLIEPQLTRTGDAATNVYILDHHQTFANVKGALAIDWLTRYPAMPWHSRETLFGIAATHADRAQLNALIETRCNDLIDLSDSGVIRRKFWLLRHFFFILPTSDTRWAEFSVDPRAILEIEHHSGQLGRHDSQGWPQLNAEQVYRVLDAFVSVWPKVPLPSSWGSGDPPGETAYRYLTDVVFTIGRDDPSNSIPVFDRILLDFKFSDLWNSVKSQRAEAVRQQALSGFRAPTPADVSQLLDDSKIASVEDMRALLIELLDEFQYRLKGDATNPVEVFYSGDKRINENKARDRIVDRLQDFFRALNLGVVVEHQMANEKRCDFTASTVIDKSQVILVTELKGQWNPELYTAASVQLAGRYSIYPGAANQGVYLVLWFGSDEKIAGRKEPSITSPALLREQIIRRMPAELAGRIDVYVLDVSRAKPAKRAKKKKKTATKAAKTTRAKSAATTNTRTKAVKKVTARPSARSAKKAISKAGNKTATKKGTKTDVKRTKKVAVKRSNTSVERAKKTVVKRTKARKVSKTTKSRR